MITAKNGQEEEAAKNNHGTCWAVQVAAFAAFTDDENALPRAALHSYNLLSFKNKPSREERVLAAGLPYFFASRASSALRVQLIVVASSDAPST